MTAREKNAKPVEAAPPAEPDVIKGGPPENETGGTLTIDLGALQSNFRALWARATPAECAAVV